MKTPIRFLAGCMLALGALGPGAQAFAAGYPDRPIRLIVPTSPGSTADVVARVVAENLGKTLAQPLIVENLAGAAGIPGTRQLVAAKPDGYTLAIVSSNHAINPSLYKTMPYDSVKDVTPISVIGTTPLVMVAAESSPYRSIGELLAAARAQPGKINYGSSGSGSVLHLAGELLKSRAGVDMMHIPYRGGNALITDVMSGQIQVAFTELATSLGHVKSGQVRALAVTTQKRVDVLPDVPALNEFIPGFEASQWIGLVGPKGTPPAVVERLNAEINAGLADRTIQARFADLGASVLPGTADAFGQFIRDETAKWGKVIKAANIKI